MDIINKVISIKIIKKLEEKVLFLEKKVDLLLDQESFDNVSILDIMSSNCSCSNLTENSFKSYNTFVSFFFNSNLFFISYFFKRTISNKDS